MRIIAGICRTIVPLIFVLDLGLGMMTQSRVLVIMAVTIAATQTILRVVFPLIEWGAWRLTHRGQD